MDREKLIEQLETDAIATDTGFVEIPLFQFSEILALLKEQEKRINELEEKLRLLEYGDQDTLQVNKNHRKRHCCSVLV
jgi:hypothetical protein